MRNIHNKGVLITAYATDTQKMLFMRAGEHIYIYLIKNLDNYERMKRETILDLRALGINITK